MGMRCRARALLFLAQQVSGKRTRRTGRLESSLKPWREAPGTAFQADQRHHRCPLGCWQAHMPMTPMPAPTP